MQRHDEEAQVVVLTAEDIKNVKDFFEHFKIEMPNGIASCIDRFSKDPKAITFQDQRDFRALIAHAMVTVDHPLIKDKAFANIREKCEKAWYDSQFDSDVVDLFDKNAPKEA